MTTPFGNPLTGAQGTLVRSQIKSPNFSLSGKTGWAILKNGSAFFFNVTATGTITASSFVGTDFVIGTPGAFFYSGTPQLGNPPVVSIAAPGVTADTFGNPVTPILTIGQLTGSYVQAGTDGTLSLVNSAGVTVISLHPSSGKLQFFDTATGTLKMLIQENSISGETGDLSISSGVSTTPGDQALGMLLAGLAEASGQNPNLCIAPGTPSRLSTALVEIQGPQVIVGSAPAGQLFLLQNNSSGPTSASAVLVAAAAGDAVAGVQVATDTNLRWHIDSAGKMFWGSGSAGADTSLYRTSAGNQLASDPIVANVSGSAETWHAVAFSNSWTNAAGRTPSQFRLLPSPANAVQMEGSLTIPAGFAAGQTIFTLPAAYRPVTTKSMNGREVTRNVPALFSISTAGLVAWQAGAGAVAGDTVDFDRIFQLDI